MNLLGPSPDIWARKTFDFFSSVFKKRFLEWLPVAEGGGGSNVGRGTTSSASHQTLLVLNC